MKNQELVLATKINEELSPAEAYLLLHTGCEGKKLLEFTYIELIILDVIKTAKIRKSIGGLSSPILYIYLYPGSRIDDHIAKWIHNPFIKIILENSKGIMLQHFIMGLYHLMDKDLGNYKNDVHKQLFDRRYLTPGFISTYQLSDKGKQAKARIKEILNIADKKAANLEKDKEGTVAYLKKLGPIYSLLTKVKFGYMHEFERARYSIIDGGDRRAATGLTLFGGT